MFVLGVFFEIRNISVNLGEWFGCCLGWLGGAYIIPVLGATISFKGGLARGSVGVRIGVCGVLREGGCLCAFSYLLYTPYFEVSHVLNFGLDNPYTFS